MVSCRIRSAPTCTAFAPPYRSRSNPGEQNNKEYADSTRLYLPRLSDDPDPQINLLIVPNDALCMSNMQEA